MVLEPTLFNKKLTLTSIFLSTIFFIVVADSALSYLFPIISEHVLGSNLQMGLILGFSSVVGLLCDFLFPQLFKGRTWKFFLTFGVFLTFFFPIFISFGANFNSIFFFLLASAIWGIYYEFLIFGIQKFIVSTQHKDNYSKSWATLYTFTGTAKILGPILGAILFGISINNSPLFILFIQLISFLLLFFAISFRSRKFHSSYEPENVIRQINLAQEFKYWRLIIPSIFPLFISSLVIVSIDATYWVIGGLLGHELYSQDLSWLPIGIFVITGIIGSITLSTFKVKRRKKRLTHIFLVISGLILSLLSLTGNNIVIAILLFFSSLSLSFAGVFNESVFSDLMGRLGKNDIHMIGISRLTNSLAYAIMPVVVGLFADKLGYVTTFSLVGIITLISGLILLVITPKKLRLQQTKIEGVES